MAGKLEYPAHVISGRGVPVQLIDGSTVTLIFGFASIMQLEDEFGSMEQALQSLGSNTKLGTIAKLMAAALMHEGHPTHGLLSDVERLAPLLDTAQLQTYSDAIGKAFESAFPKSEGGAHVGEDPTQGDRSPGPSGGTPQPSSSVDPIASSGG